MIRRIFKWIFKDELDSLTILKSDLNMLKQILEVKNQKLDNLFENIDISVDVHERSRSWAVVSIQGKLDYIKFIDLGFKEARDIQYFLRNFDRDKVKIDATPFISKFMKCQ